jgi:tetratricopeptide (TPR) repeat protein
MRTLQALMICAAVAGLPQAAVAAPSEPDRKSCFEDSGDTAIAACTRAINSRRHKGETLSRLYGARGFEYKVKNDLDSALADYNEAIRIFPSVIESLDARATVHTQKGNYRAAVSDYTAALKLKNSGYAAVNRGDTYLILNEYDKALADYRHGSNLDPKDPTDYGRRCFARAVVGDLQLALADCEESLRRRPNHRYTIAGRAFVRLKRGEIDQALADYNAALTSDITDVVGQALTQYGRGIAKLKKGDVRGGNTDMDAVRKSWPDIGEAFARLGVPQPRPTLSAAPAQGATPVEATRAPLYAVAGANKERRVALVVANAAYRTVSALSNPARDGTRMAASLRAIGFETVVVENNLTREAFVKALRSFEDIAAQSEWAVVYYAGHGIEVGGMNYLVPVDARLRTDRDVQDEAITLDRVLSSVERAKKLRVVILDACRDNPFAARMKTAGATRSIGRGLSPIEPEGGSLVAYSAKHGFIALDGDGENSPFVDALVRHLHTPNLEINKLFRLVRDDVLAATGRRQEPFLYGSLPGEDFFFVQK